METCKTILDFIEMRFFLSQKKQIPNKSKLAKGPANATTAELIGEITQLIESQPIETYAGTKNSNGEFKNFKITPKTSQK